MPFFSKQSAAWIHGSASSWKIGAVGGGGYVTGVDAVGSTKVLRNDTYGAWAYIDGSFQQVISSQRLLNGPMVLGGVIAGPSGIASNVYEIVISPSNSSIVYAIFPGLIAGVNASLWMSTDSGRTWTQTATQNILGSYNSPDRLGGKRMAVDPNNPNVVYWGNSDGTIGVTYNGGATNSSITTGATSVTYPCIAIDASSGTTTVSGVTITKGVYIGYFGAGTAVYESRDGAQTFSATTGGPTTILYMKCSPDGVLYCTGINFGAYRYATPSTTSGLTVSTWMQLTTSNGLHTNLAYQSLAFDPATPGVLVLLLEQGQIAVSINYGTTFFQSVQSSSQVPKVPFRISNTILWLAWTNADDFSTGDCCIDPQDGKLIVTMGIGVWKTPVLKSDQLTAISSASTSGTSLTCTPVSDIIQVGWEIQIGSTYAGKVVTKNSSSSYVMDTSTSIASGSGNAGLPPTMTEFTNAQQGLIVTMIKKAPGQSNIVMTAEDRAVLFAASPTQYPINNWAPFGAQQPSGTNIHHSFGADYSKSDSTFWMLGIDSSENYVNKSTDGAQTWTPVAGTLAATGNEPYPAVGFGTGPTANCVLVFNDGTAPQYTKDGGATWNFCQLDTSGNLPTTGWGGFHGKRKVVVASDTTSGVFYLYNSSFGFYKSVDGGAIWHQQCTQTQANFNSKPGAPCATLLMMPGNEGILFFAPGYYSSTGSHPQTGYAPTCSADGGQTWAIITTFDECWCMAFGKGRNGVPALYVAGYVHGSLVPGIFRCENISVPSLNPTGMVWTRLTSSPANNFDSPNALWADLDTFGQVYVANHGYQYNLAA